MTSTTCYLCAVNREPSSDPSAIGCCSTCGAFTCLSDGARVHATGRFECAICLVRVLLRSAGVLAPGDGGGGGGGKAVTMAEGAARVREILDTEHFESECRELAAASGGYRFAWRPLLAQAQLPAEVAREIGERLDILAGAGSNVAERVEEGLVNDTIGTEDRSLLADAAGLGEYS